jgi:hypothetical protein
MRVTLIKKVLFGDNYTKTINQGWQANVSHRLGPRELLVWRMTLSLY